MPEHVIDTRGNMSILAAPAPMKVKNFDVQRTPGFNRVLPALPGYSYVIYGASAVTQMSTVDTAFSTAFWLSTDDGLAPFAMTAVSAPAAGVASFSVNVSNLNILTKSGTPVTFTSDGDIMFASGSLFYAVVRDGQE